MLLQHLDSKTYLLLTWAVLTYNNTLNNIPTLTADEVLLDISTPASAIYTSRFVQLVLSLVLEHLACEPLYGVEPLQLHSSHLH